MTRFQRIKEKITANQLSLLYIGVVSFLIYILFNDRGYDDPFITYRYAANLSAGNGFVYNIGEDVLSTSSPLFSLLLALLRIPSISTPEIAILIGAISLALGGICLWNLGKAWEKPGISWTGILLYPIFPLLLQTLGSETPLFLLFCLSAFYFYLQRRHSLAFALGALALLTRSEGALVIAILLVAYVLDNKAIPRTPLLIMLLISLPWLLYATLNFGSPIPVTLTAKQHQGLLTISERFLPRLRTIANWGYVQRWNYWVLFLVAITGLLQLRRQDKDMFYFLLWPLLHNLSLSLLGVSGYFWYYAPIVPALIVTAGNGFNNLAKVLRNKFPNPVFPYTALTSLIAILLLLPTVSHAIITFQNPDERLQIYRAIGEWIETNTDSDDAVGALEVGIIGYFSNRRMIDFSGVIQPEIAVKLITSPSYQEVAKWAIKEYKPEYLVLSTEWGSQFRKDSLIHECQIMRVFKGNKYGYGSDLAIYKCD